jgi:hypothetical protein
MSTTMTRTIGMAALLVGTALVACTAAAQRSGRASPTAAYDPRIDPANFVAAVTNPYFPLTPGTVYRFAGTGASRSETNVVTVTRDRRLVAGIPATVVHDEVFEHGKLAEDTYDWYAQDRQGNVWYLGEDSHTVKNGRVTSAEGSWETGVKGAKPGVVMWADPAAHLGEAYRQEYLPGQAEDMGKVISARETVAVPHGTFQNCVLTEDTTPLEPRVRERKYYCSGLGVVREVESATAGSDLVGVDRP